MAFGKFGGYKQKKYKIHILKRRYQLVPLKSKKTGKNVIFKGYKGAKKFLDKIKKSGGKGYIKKA